MKVQKHDASPRKIPRLNRGRSVQAVLVGVCLWISGLAPGWLGAVELRTAQVAESGGTYRLKTEVLVGAPAADVRNALIQYENLPSLNPNIESVEVLGRHSDGLRVRLRTKTCVLLFCQRYEWVQRVTTTANGDILAEVEPENSDLRRGFFRYTFRQVGNKCLLVTQAVVQPRQGVPSSWFSRGVMRNLLSHEARTLSSRLERLLASNSSTHVVAPS